MLGYKIFFSILGAVVLTVLFTLHIQRTKPTNFSLNFTPLREKEKNIFNLKLLQKDDYSLNIDISFHFKLLNPICHKTEEPLILFLVHSSSDHFEKRHLIRDTWGKSGENVKIAFLIGRSLIEVTNEKLKVESYQHKDIIQGDFIDTYENITYKHTMGMKYVIYHCPGVKYVVKVDDDVLVNTSKLKTFLSGEISPNGAKDVIMCTTVVNARTLRSYRSKWRISFDEYPYRYFPPFCRGMTIIYTPDVIFNLYNKAQRDKKYVKLDDVFYTGLTAESIGYTMHTNIEHLMSFDYKRPDQEAYVPEKLSSYLFIGSELNERDILKLWNLLEKYEDEKFYDL